MNPMSKNQQAKRFYELLREQGRIQPIFFTGLLDNEIWVSRHNKAYLLQDLALGHLSNIIVNFKRHGEKVPPVILAAHAKKRAEIDEERLLREIAIPQHPFPWPQEYPGTWKQPTLRHRLYRRILRVFHRQPFTDALAFKPEGVYAVGQQPNVMNILTTVAENICLWYDGTMRPCRGHNGSCEWEFDGQVFWHKPLTTNNHS